MTFLDIMYQRLDQARPGIDKAAFVDLMIYDGSLLTNVALSPHRREPLRALDDVLVPDAEQALAWFYELADKHEKDCMISINEEHAS